jgi:cob(I)alamin adenosyltransferase
MSISTKKGDEGQTRLFSGQTVLKSDLRPRAYGALDEAVSAMGLARALASQEQVQDELLRIQKVCFLIGAELATTADTLTDLPERLSREHLHTLEALGTRLESEVDLPPVFVVPGAASSGAALDLARSIVRRAERSIVQLLASDPAAVSNENLVPYINRLSDVLFLLARHEEQTQGAATDRLKERAGEPTRR